MSAPLIECVPNFSEGRDARVIDAIAAKVAEDPPNVILDRTSDPDHHRSVITFAGNAESVALGAFKAAAEALRLIDMRLHCGVHPRLGALDVLPFVPLKRATMGDCVSIAHSVGERIWRELHVPVYFYGAAALRPERAQLEDVRRGGFEGLSEAALFDDKRSPDLGGPGLHPSAGAVIVGARKILIAFNVDLKTDDVKAARSIARAIRTSSGGLPAVKALGLALPSRGMTQISMNLTDFEITPPHVVYQAIEKLAREQGVEIYRSELIGLLPTEALVLMAKHSLKLEGLNSGQLITHAETEQEA